MDIHGWIYRGIMVIWSYGYRYRDRTGQDRAVRLHATFLARSSLTLGHLLLDPESLQVLLLVIMRSSLDEPLCLQRHITAHILLTRQHELEINHPAWIDLEQRTRRMQVNRLPVLNRAIAIAPSLQTRRIREKPCRDGLLNGHEIALAGGAN